MTDDDRRIDWVEAVRALPRNAAVIVRSRSASRREALARTLMPIARKTGVLVFIAADAALAIRLRADGVHWPENLPANLASLRRIGPKLILTMSAHGAPGLVAARRHKADAAILSPMFATQSHPEKPGLRAVRWGALRRLAHLPVLALGGIGAQSAAAAVSLGASGLVVIGAWTETKSTKR
jgi:thiamine-phosphate pyrophosphorylase